MIVIGRMVSFNWQGPKPTGIAQSEFFRGRDIQIRMNYRARPIVRKGHVVLDASGIVDPTVLVNEQTLAIGSAVVIDLVLGRGWMFGRWCPKTEWDAFVTSIKKQRLEQEPILSELVEEIAGTVS